MIYDRRKKAYKYRKKLTWSTQKPLSPHPFPIDKCFTKIDLFKYRFLPSSLVLAKVLRFSESKSCFSFFSANYLRKSALMLIHPAGSPENEASSPIANEFCSLSSTVRGVTRLDGARGKKQVWRPYVRN